MNQNKSYEFTKLYDEILALQSLKASDGSVIDLSLNTKVIWCYMYRRYDFYGQLGNDFYENITDMSSKLGIALSTFKRSLTTLKAVGAIQIYKLKTQGFIESNRYVVKHPVTFCQKQQVKHCDYFSEQDSDEPF